ncbi:MAG: ABC transporter ATP-binding protein [Ignavibacteriaceae bacterium]|nr:ABC transporter ATP-binding protein [Ignavibacteriaceae bacterium]
MFLELKNITKLFNSKSGVNRRVVENLSLTLDESEKGKIVFFHAPFGSGKSTLLKIISGVESSSAGEVIVEGKNIRNNDLGLYFIPQKATSFPWLSVQENIETILKLKNQPIVPKKIKEIISLCELEGYEEHFPNEKSLGFRFRISLASCLILSPKILLLDEPFKEIDKVTKDELILLLQKVKELGITIIYASSNIKEILTVADIVYLFELKPLSTYKKFSFSEESVMEKFKILGESLFNQN